MKRNILIATLCYFSVLTLFFFSREKISNPVNVPSGAYSFGEKEDQQKRQEWQWKMLHDPATGKIPEGIRGKEIAFAKTLPTDNDANIKGGMNAKTPNEHPFTLQGPFNVGGRTRALAIDVSDENVIFSGSVSGGLWRSADGGNTWAEVTSPSQHLGVTAIVQDKRPGKTNNWYYSTGEGYGTSASGGSAFFLGDGLFKSADGGLNWAPIDATDNGNPQTFTTNWQVIWNIATHPSDSDTIIFAATYGAIYRTLNGGNSWSAMLSSTAASYFSDVASATNGVVYATMSSEGGKKGIWRSPDGYSSFINITPVNWFNGTDTLHFPSVYDRNVIGIDPNNENVVYFFAYTPGFGKPTTDFQGDTEWVSLWKYEYLSGDGSGTGGNWTDLSENLPYDGSIFGNLVVQGSYDMVVRVMPGNSNNVFIGGTNLYRSTDGFTSAANTTQLGGYGIGATMPFFTTYPNHHPDQHNLAFLPSNPNVLISASDGGVYKTSDCLAPGVTWTSLNRGYQSSQFYTIALDHGTQGSHVVTGGLQDWGSWWTNSWNPTSDWTFPSTGDGSFCAVADGGGTYYYSRQGGKIMKATLDNSGLVTSFRRIDPIGPDKSNYMFIAPFILDPVDNNVMYLTEGENLWRNGDLSLIPLDGGWDTISTGWFKFSFSLADTLSDITALACSKNNAAHRLYFGTDKKKVYRMDNANTGDPAPVEITATTMPANGYVSSIAVDPRDADKVLVVFSNYLVYSIFYSEDGGSTWKKVAGNLEQYSSGTGNGPSCRYASILPVGDGTVYLVSTSTGLYATDSLNTTVDSTKWIQQGASTIGNIVTVMTDVREGDGFTAVATHGNGVFTTYYSWTWEITGTRAFTDDRWGFEVFPNPAKEKATLDFRLEKNSDIRFGLFDGLGKKVAQEDWHLAKGSQRKDIKISGLPCGIYFCALTLEGKTYTKKILVSGE